MEIVEHLFESNESGCVGSLACVDGGLHIAVDVEFFFFVGVDSLAIDVHEDLLMKHYV